MNREDDNYYVEEVLSGQTQAYAELVGRHKEMVYTIAIGLLQIREEAEEVSQDAFLKAYQALSKFKKQAKFSTWLYRIVYNECISRLRKRKLNDISLDENRISISDSLIVEENNFNEEKKQRMLQEALMDLPKEDKAIILLYYFENLSIEEISVITALSKSNIKIRLFRIRNKLHERLSKSFKMEMIEI
ncbi:MAG: sigma-70 family RNA polymerase sigma factor [Bacteroidota bacterium]|nr:sigma-70 family RNA polymerase sigma factor [Bacteroidota bacterium]